MKLSVEEILHEGGEDEIAEELTKQFDTELELHDEKSIKKFIKH